MLPVANKDDHNNNLVYSSLELRNKRGRKYHQDEGVDIGKKNRSSSISRRETIAVDGELVGLHLSLPLTSS